jgi:hypothetical protein
MFGWRAMSLLARSSIIVQMRSQEQEKKERRTLPNARHHISIRGEAVHPIAVVGHKVVPLHGVGSSKGS